MKEIPSKQDFSSHGSRLVYAIVPLKTEVHNSSTSVGA